MDDDVKNISVAEGTESVLPIKTVIANADAENYKIGTDGAISINKQGIYLAFAKIHGSFRTGVAGYVKLSATGLYYSSYIVNGGDISLQFQETVSGAFFVTNKASLKLSVYSMSGEINVYPISTSPYTEIVIIKIK